MNGQSQIYLPRMTFINKIIAITCAAIFLLDFLLMRFAQINLAQILGISAEHVLSGHLYSLVTYPLFSRSIIEVILNCLMLWLMGSEFEENWGRKRYITFLLTVVIGGALFYLGLGLIFFRNHALYAFPLTGMSGIVASLCVAYAIIYPTRIFSFMMIIPIQAKYFCWILVAIALFQGVSSPMMVAAWGQLGAIISGFLFMVIISNRNFKQLSQIMGQWTQLSGRKKSKAKLTIVANDDQKPPKYWQ